MTSLNVYWIRENKEIKNLFVAGTQPIFDMGSKTFMLQTTIPTDSLAPIREIGES